MTRENFDTYYESFLGGRLFRWLDWRKIKIIISVLENLNSDIKVLDLGCGSASISSKIKKRLPSIEVIGADHSASLLKIANSRGLKTQLVNFDLPLPFEDNCLDVVLMIDTIEHVASRQGVMYQVKRILKNQGILIIFTPPYDSITWIIGEYLHGKITRRAADHISPFTQESLLWLLKQNFKNQTIGRFNFGLSMFGIASEKIPDSY